MPLSCRRISDSAVDPATDAPWPALRPLTLSPATLSVTIRPSDRDR